MIVAEDSKLDSSHSVSGFEGDDELLVGRSFESRSRKGEISITLSTVRFAAMSFLAMREHTRLELQQKLSRRFTMSSELITTAVQQLSDEALQSDERFTEAFIGMRKRKGQGPVRILNELKQRGVEGDYISRYLDQNDPEWESLAKSAALKKFGELEADNASRGRQMRFLQHRGFTTDQIRSLWK